MEDTNKSEVHLTYWNCRGRAQVCRYTLEAVGVTYTETRYEVSDYKDWFERDKPVLTLPLPNLPHFKDGEIHFTEHDAILRYIARKYKPELLGKNLADEAVQENYLCYLTKLFQKLADFCHTPNPTDESRSAFAESHSPQLTGINTALEGKQFLVGDYLTVADLYFYEQITILELISKDTFAKYPNIQKFKENLENLDWFSNYLKGEKFVSRPYFGPRAIINN
ncbi:glutathione s-n-terminal domain containing protein [Stylonychia lemnae]|uniref:glutathione transferase n=1 Tax=Stylonychia lemnae TaxID=5949 RepID=A0A078AI32_STYLE|nr:glutathione s-n-terminal domain containing protein [Stylonychia lemnae]|eukprot:CDW81596.1 glutathione s-n-terminal domain containing protein [Stylonychia lemnae]